MEYIEANLDARIDLALLAKKSALSKYHFHRIFKAISGQQPLKYVEKRRLARAADELLTTDRRIVDIAFEFGFGSHESFIRAFKKTFGLPPSQFRKHKPHIAIQDKLRIGALDLKLIHGGAIPNPTILHKPAFRIAGLAYAGRDTAMIDRLWERFWQRFEKQRDRVVANQFLGACFHDIDMRNNEVFEYYAGFELVGRKHIPGSMTSIMIADNDYAMFTHKGPVNRIEQTYDQIYGHWLPLSEYKPMMDLDIIVIDQRFAGLEEKNEIDILIPVG